MCQVITGIDRLQQVSAKKMPPSCEGREGELSHLATVAKFYAAKIGSRCC